MQRPATVVPLPECVRAAGALVVRWFAGMEQGGGGVRLVFTSF